MIMKKLLLILSFVLFSFEANASNKYYLCEDVYIKVENPLFSKRKLYFREEGKWVHTCHGEVRSDSFKCFYPKKSKYNYYIFDEFDKSIVFYLKNGMKEITQCSKVKPPN